LTAILNNKGNALEALLLFEFCEATSPVWKRISYTSEPVIKFAAKSHLAFKQLEDLKTQEIYFTAKIRTVMEENFKMDTKLTLLLILEVVSTIWYPQ
jgi:hypothetical protein